MTRILLILNNEYPMTYIRDDPRPPREVMAAINTGRLRIGEGEINLGSRSQWAMLHPSINVVTVVLCQPPVRLNERHYDVLFGLADGLTPARIAEQHGFSLRAVHKSVDQLKKRFSARSPEEVVARAVDLGLLGE